MTKKELVMEVDYFDLPWSGFDKPEDIERLFQNCDRAGIRRVIWGTSNMHPSKFRDMYLPDGRDGSRRLAKTLRTFNSLEAGSRLAKKYGITFIPYLRLMDFGYPGDCDEALDRIPHGWWESRCGQFKLRGWPCYNEKAVRDYMLQFIPEIMEYPVDGLMFMIGRNHVPYTNPHRQPHLFGYNPATAELYQRLYGVDIRKFDYCEHKMTEALGQPAWLCGAEYFGTEPLDFVKWHLAKGEGLVQFIREARALMGSKPYVAVEFNGHFIPQLPWGIEELPGKYLLDPVAMSKEGLMNEWVIAYNYHMLNYEPLEQMHSVTRDVAANGSTLNMWMNDIFSKDGGAEEPVSLKKIETYLRRFEQSDMHFATLHEAAFIMTLPNEKEIFDLCAAFTRHF